jgi:hypothetical protein
MINEGGSLIKLGRWGWLDYHNLFHSMICQKDPLEHMLTHYRKKPF